MNLKRYKLLLVPLIIFVIAMISMSMMLIFQFRTVAEISQLPFSRLLVMFIETTLAVLLFNYIVRWLNRKFPWNRSWILRVFFDLLLAMVMPMVLLTFVTFVHQDCWIDPEEIGEEAKLFLFILPLVANALFLLIVEMIISVEERNGLAMKLTNIEKEQLNTKYGALKEQLDHHFLFNNLSVLSSLIYEDVEKADRFIQDFSSIYRYVLQINQRNLVTVAEELDFIDNYLNLYKFRFERGFEFTVAVDDETKKLMIPPLTLQVLVENAIKHNVVSCKHPLILHIESHNKELWVSNNLQEKEDKVISTKTGQSNLIEKCKLLECNPPVFKIENDQYISIVSLIEA